MSWKNFVTAGLLCALASPAFAVPTVTAVGGGNTSSNFLNASGQWAWQIQIAPTNPIPGGSSPLAAELGFRETSTRSIVAAATKNAAVWDTDNPGTQIFTWEALTDVDPSPSVTNNKPVGLQTNLATDEIFAALGSVDIASTAAANFIAFNVQRPQTAAAATLSTTTVQLLGKYGTGSVRGRIAEASGASATNNDVYSGSVTFSAEGWRRELGRRDHERRLLHTARELQPECWYASMESRRFQRR